MERTPVLKRFITKKNLLTIAGLVLGGIGGYIYYLKIGCDNGSCAISSNPYISTTWGALVGYLLFDFFKSKEVKKTN